MNAGWTGIVVALIFGRQAHFWGSITRSNMRREWGKEK